MHQCPKEKATAARTWHLQCTMWYQMSHYPGIDSGNNTVTFNMSNLLHHQCPASPIFKRKTIKPNGQKAKINQALGGSCIGSPPGTSPSPPLPSFLTRQGIPRSSLSISPTLSTISCFIFAECHAHLDCFGQYSKHNGHLTDILCNKKGKGLLFHFPDHSFRLDSFFLCPS